MMKTMQQKSPGKRGHTQLLPITKSEYLQYLACQPEFWYYKHCPDEFAGPPDKETQHIMQQGNAIESLARDYFEPSETLQISFQRTFKSNQLLAKADIILTELPSGINTLIEVKSGTSVKSEYVDDLAFQVIVAKEEGFTFHRIGVLHVNGSFVRLGPIDVQEFFAFEDVTEAVLAKVPETRISIEAAIHYLQEEEPVIPLHAFCSQKLACPALQKQYPKLPEYSVFDISGIRQNKLQELLKQGIVDIQHVPSGFKLSDRQRFQVEVAQSGAVRISHNNIQRALDTLRFPLYFLDYETLQYGIPQYDVVKPYQQMVFQWSLHKLYADDQEPIHLEFLSDGKSHPALEFVRTLHGKIPYDGGSILVWNKSFETARNKELALMYPEFEPFLVYINTRIYDLMEIFQQQHYVHPEFKGSNSIKQVLPVIDPHLSYHDLEVNQGILASISWFELITGKISESDKRERMNHLRQYCKLDTLAMVAIYKHLQSVANPS